MNICFISLGNSGVSFGNVYDSSDRFSNTNIESIKIPEGVTKIGNYCFEYCSELTNITLPSSLI